MASLEALLPTLADEAEIAATRRQLRYWHKRQQSAQLGPVPSGEQVAFGTTVAFTLHGKARTITLVGDDEAEPAANLIAFSAPLCRAMMGAQVGDCLDFGGKAEALEIVAITPS